MGRPGLTALLSMAGFCTFSLAFWIARHVPRSQSAALRSTLSLSRDSRHRNVAALSRSPLFPIGSPGLVFGRAPILWILAAGIATYTAYRHGTFGPHSMEWRVNTFISNPLEAPFAEEFAFGELYSRRSTATSLGSQSLLRLRLGTLVSAVAFSAAHPLALLGGMPMTEAPVFVASALLLGIVFGHLYQRTQNLWYGIFIHALGNFSQLLP